MARLRTSLVNTKTPLVSRGVFARRLSGRLERRPEFAPYRRFQSPILQVSELSCEQANGLAAKGGIG